MEPEIPFRTTPQGYIEREISRAIETAANFFSVITVTGPRQSGKSTLLRHLYPEMPYMSLENHDIRAAARQDPKGFLATYPKGMIIDEVQHVPELLSYIQGRVDDDSDVKYLLQGVRNSHY